MNRVTRQALSLLRKASRAETLPKMLVHVERACALMTPPRKRPAKQLPKQLQSTKPQRSAAHKMSTKEIRAAVMERARLVCENCWAGGPLQLDHWLGGAGRRRPQQSIETTWALCSRCHAERSRNDPTAAYWNDRFARHCFKYCYQFTPHIEHKPLPRRGTA